MLEPPALDAGPLLTHLRRGYALPLKQLEFLPLGADTRTAVYRAAADGIHYFVKLRRGDFLEASVALPYRLAANGEHHVIAPIPTRTGELWTQFQGFAVTLYPFVAGHSGWHATLTPEQWRALGSSLRHLHALDAPDLAVPQARYAPTRRDQVSGYLAHLPSPTDAAARGLVALLERERETVLTLVARAEWFAADLRRRSLPFCLCHGDIHAGNVLVAEGQLYIVDWDTLVRAPKERDLMFIGAGIGGIWDRAEESAWFYGGYGPTDVDRLAVAYYRLERIIEDIAVTCDDLLVSAAGGDDRAVMLRQLEGYFTDRTAIRRALEDA